MPVAVNRNAEVVLYHLNVFHIDLPLLCDRRDDIPLLMDHFLCVYSHQHEVNLRGFTQRALRLGSGGALQRMEESVATNEQVSKSTGSALGQSITDIERRLYAETLSKTNGNISAAARAVGLSRPAFEYRLRKYGLISK